MASELPAPCPPPILLHIEGLIVATEFSGVVDIRRGDRALFLRAPGFADCTRALPNIIETQFAIASGTKTLTALAVMSLVAEGAVALDAPVLPLLAELGELVPADVTVRQLLAHTSGIGDYFDEVAIADIEQYVLDVPAPELESPADFVKLLRGQAANFAPGSDFRYSNSGDVAAGALGRADLRTELLRHGPGASLRSCGHGCDDLPPARPSTLSRAGLLTHAGLVDQ